MKHVPDAFLLEVAGILASLLGFFVVGVFFYVQRGIFPEAAAEARGYLRAVTGLVILLYGSAVALALALVIMPVSSGRLVYATTSLLILAAVARASVAVRRLHRMVNVKVVSQAAMWICAGTVIGLPWILGGTRPQLEDIVWGILLVGTCAFASSTALIVATFDLIELERIATKGKPARSARERRKTMDAHREEVDRMAESSMDEFEGRLQAILEGKGSKKAKAEAAVVALNDLVGSLEEDVVDDTTLSVSQE